MENSISSDLIRGHIDTIILYSLVDGEKHVQQIIDSVYEKSEKKYELNQATLYSSLKRLEKEKFLKAFWNDSENGRRRFFSITESGKKVIEENLTNWSFSRSIIDKLLGIEDQHIETQINDIESLNKPVNESFNEVKKENLEHLVLNKDEFMSFSQQIIDEKPENDDNSLDKKILEKEINFRNILNGLIKATAIVEKNASEQIKEIKKSPNSKEQTKQKQENLQEAIVKSQTSQRISQCNIDFSDLEINASKDGYKIRFSNTKYQTKKGCIFINKLNMFSSFFLSIVMALELLVLSTTSYSLLNLSSFKIIIACLVCILPSVIFTLLYFFKPNYLSKSPKTNGIITFLIIIFDFLVLLFVVEWLLGIDFADNFNLIAYFLIPSLILLDILFFLLIRKILANKKIFNN